MPTAINPETGEFLVLGGDGQWAKPTIAKNPQTGESLYLEGDQWKPAPFQATLSEKDKKIAARNSGGDKRAYDALVQGVSLGFSDEVGAAAATIGPFLKTLTTTGSIGQALDAGGKRYDEALARERGSLKSFAEQNPVGNAALQVTGGMASAPALIGKAAGAVAGAPTLGQLSLQAAKGAATPGAIAGFGSGEGGVGERLQSAATTGLLSAGVGAATPALVQGAGGLFQLGKNVFGKTNADETAQRLILRAMERDGLSVDDAVTAYNSGRLTGAKPETLIDLGGENTRGLLRGVASTPGPAKNMTQDFVQSRQAGQGERIADDIAGSISKGKFYETADDLLAARSEQAAPLYERAFDSGPVTSDRVSQFLSDPVLKQGLRQGLEVQRLESLASGKPFNPSEFGITGFNEAGDPIMSAVPNMRLLDAAKRGLDDTLETYRDKTTGRLVLDQKGRAIDSVRKAYVKTLDELNPDYAVARAAWAGPSQSRDAMAMGRSILKKDSELTAKAIENMSPSDREFFKVGVVRALKDQADNVRDSNDLSKRIAATPGAREKLRAAFDSESDFNAFLTNLKRESQMFENAQSVSPKANSRTAVLTEEIADVRKSPVVQFASDLRQGIMPAVTNAAGRLYDRGRGINQNTSEALAKALLSQDPMSTLGNLGNRRLQDEALAREIAKQLRAIGSLEGRAIGAAN